MMTRSDYRVVHVDPTKVFLVDLDYGNMSVTNDAEAVYNEIQQKHPGARVVYRDSMGEWDEIVIQRGRASFIPYEEHMSFVV